MRTDPSLTGARSGSDEIFEEHRLTIEPAAKREAFICGRARRLESSMGGGWSGASSFLARHRFRGQRRVAAASPRSRRLNYSVSPWNRPGRRMNNRQAFTAACAEIPSEQVQPRMAAPERQFPDLARPSTRPG